MFGRWRGNWRLPLALDARISAAFGCDLRHRHRKLRGRGTFLTKKISTSMRGLKELFSDPTLATRASFRCSTEEPSDIDILFESIFPEENGE